MLTIGEVVWEKLKQGSAQTLQDAFKKFNDKSCKSIFESMRAYETCYQKAARVTSRFSQDVAAAEDELVRASLSSHTIGL